MAITFISGIELGTLGEFSSTSGSVSASTAQHNTGAYSLRVNPSADNAYVAVAASQRRISLYLYIVDAPDNDCYVIYNGWSLVLTTDRYVDLYEGATKRVDGTTQLNTGTWYRLSITVNSSDGWCYYWIDGNPEGNYDGTTTNIGQFIGAYTLGSAPTTDMYRDDSITDDTASSADD